MAIILYVALKSDIVICNFGGAGLGLPDQDSVQAQPVTENTEPHPVTDQRQTQPVTEQRQTQPVTEKSQTQPVTEKSGTQPVTYKTQTHPVTEKTQTQSVTDKTQTQSVTDKTQTQQFTDKTQTKSVTDKTQTQSVTDKSQTQSVIDKTQTQQIIEKTQTQPISQKTQSVTDKTQTQSVTDKTQTQSVTDKTKTQAVTVKTLTQPVTDKTQTQFVTEKTQTQDVSTAVIESATNQDIIKLDTTVPPSMISSPIGQNLQLAIYDLAWPNIKLKPSVSPLYTENSTNVVDLASKLNLTSQGFDGDSNPSLPSGGDPPPAPDPIPAPTIKTETQTKDASKVVTESAVTSNIPALDTTVSNTLKSPTIALNSQMYILDWPNIKLKSYVDSLYTGSATTEVAFTFPYKSVASAYDIGCHTDYNVMPVTLTNFCSL
ncbi:uncharacterized protein [Mytilus edulis]|uniref:uncharacterized protein n=1 Tax=Mytilus edulis TaxID=6550 RepID=UPI0039F07E2B